MEDVRIGRKTKYLASHQDLAPAGTIQVVCPRRANRVGLVLSLFGNNAIIGTNVSPVAQINGLVILTTGMPYVILRVEDIGDLITEQFVAQDFSGAGSTLYMTEFYLDQE